MRKTLRSILATGLLGAGLAACSPAQMQSAAVNVAEGQLVCKLGAATAAMLNPDGSPFLAKGASRDVVAGVCNAINGVTVSPPASGAADGVVTVSLPVPIKS